MNMKVLEKIPSISESDRRRSRTEIKRYEWRSAEYTLNDYHAKDNSITMKDKVKVQTLIRRKKGMQKHYTSN